MPAEPVLSSRALNRATLERQLLLRRASMPVIDAVAHLVGLQAQLPLNPYLALWSRLDRFDPNELGELLHARRVVRIVVMRVTIHLVTADDCLVLRPLVQPAVDRELARHRDFGPALAGVDVEPIIAAARALLAQQPLTGPKLRAALAARFADVDPAAMAYACRNHLALVQVPPRGVWGRSGQVTTTTTEAWLGRPLATDPSIDDILLRYFAAFGPATAADAATWSGLTGLGEVVERLRPQLRPFRDERGRELLDHPDAPRPDADTPAPPRFLPEYDNLLLSHADRSRFVTADTRVRLFAAAGPVHGTLLQDGCAAGVWRLDRDSRGVATLVVQLVEPVPKRATAEIEAEGRRLLGLIAADASGHDVRVIR
ncbi:MAG TPA: winged helix DNA-binding domain-containing protein [Acidimicrobiales bacterium]|nr:winged helix DNA-binding domain-containing protein [Acidimicrobiales bacterium]